MSNIIDNYQTLIQEREKLKELKKSLKDEPLKALHNFGIESSLYEKIEELRDSILEESKNYFKSLPHDEKAIDFINRFKEIEEQKIEVQQISKQVSGSKKSNLSLEFLKGMTKIQEHKNILIEDCINTIKEMQTINIKKKKM